jgi:hypothetical protein
MAATGDPEIKMHFKLREKHVNQDRTGDPEIKIHFKLREKHVNQDRTPPNPALPIELQRPCNWHPSCCTSAVLTRLYIRVHTGVIRHFSHTTLAVPGKVLVQTGPRNGKHQVPL